MKTFGAGGAWWSDDNKFIKSEIERYRNLGVRLPEFDTNKSSMIPVVSYTKSFDLTVFVYIGVTDDNGFLMYHIPNFTTSNLFNFKILEKNDGGFSAIEVMSSAMIQVQELAKKVDYPYNIASSFDRDYMVIKCTLLPIYEQIVRDKISKN